MSNRNLPGNWEIFYFLFAYFNSFLYLCSVLKINIMAKNKNLTTAKKQKNDEFYTRLFDIENELKYYKDQFYDKVVYCNCDNPTKSEFCTFFRLKFCDWGLKKLIVTCITEDNSNGLAYIWDRDINGNGIMDEYEVTAVPMQTNGDFRSPECIAYLQEADIVCTNPPFSLFREYIKQLMDYDKKFLVIGNNNAITIKRYFLILKTVNYVWDIHLIKLLNLKFQMAILLIEKKTV